MYENTKPEDFAFIVYENTYDIQNLRLSVASGLFVTTLSAFISGFIHPVLPVLFLYDYYLVVRQMMLLNQTVEFMILSQCKTKVDVHTLNFMGFFKQFRPD
jgi:hypothetical protein